MRHHAEVYPYQGDFDTTEWGWRCDTCGEYETGYTRPDAADEDRVEHGRRIDPEGWRSAS